jgi:hypothetical protein
MDDNTPTVETPPSRARKLTPHEAKVVQDVLGEAQEALKSFNRSKLEVARLLMLIEPGIDDPNHPYEFDSQNMSIVEKKKEG